MDASNIQAAIKVADQLVSRIFNHRQFTSGEIDFLVKEFGEKAGLPENLNGILKINQNVGVICDMTSDQCKIDDNITASLSDKITLLHDNTLRLLKLEDENQQKEDQLLERSREELEKLQSESRKAISKRLESLDETLLEEELELERKFLKFEENLHKH